MVVAVALLAGLTGCTKAPSVSDVAHQNALESLRKIQSEVRVGVIYRDYMASLAEADYLVGKTNDPKLVETLKWYQQAGDMWGQEVEDRPYMWCEGKSANPLCAQYPALIKQLNGNSEHLIVASSGRIDGWWKANDSLGLANDN
jgi:hypothetical protein